MIERRYITLMNRKNSNSLIITIIKKYFNLVFYQVVCYQKRDIKIDSFRLLVYIANTPNKNKNSKCIKYTPS